MDPQSRASLLGRDDNDVELYSSKQSRSRRPKGHHLTCALLVFCVALMAICGALVLRIRALELDLSNIGYSGTYLEGLGWQQFHTYTEYSDVDTNISDPVWNSFQYDGYIAMPHTWATERGLPLAQDWPEDPTKGVYVLSAYHSLHCLIELRKVISKLISGLNVDDQLVHINHCYDNLRQSIQCWPDDTPMYAPYDTVMTGEAQFRKCRSWESLDRWAQSHTACWPEGYCHKDKI